MKPPLTDCLDGQSVTSADKRTAIEANWMEAIRSASRH